MIPRVRLWLVRYYDGAGNLLALVEIHAPTKVLARLQAGWTAGATRRTISLYR